MQVHSLIWWIMVIIFWSEMILCPQIVTKNCYMTYRLLTT